MAGFGRFELTDALPQQPASDELASSGGGQAGTPSAGMRKSRGKGRGKSSGRKGKPSAASELAAEQIREAREVNQAKNAEASTRDRMVDIGRGNQQAGRQRQVGRTREFRGRAVELGLAESVVVVFRAARGIGAAIARAFAVEGAQVTAVDRDPSVLDTASPCSLSLGLVTDVVDLAAVRCVAEAVVQQFGRCDHVVFAIGVGSGKFGFPFWKLEPADWEPVLKVNLIGAVNVAHTFAPRTGGRSPLGDRRRDELRTLVALSLFGRRPNRLADRSSVQCLQGRPDQFRPVRRQGSGAIRRAGQHALPRHGPDPSQPRRL